MIEIYNKKLLLASLFIIYHGTKAQRTTYFANEDSYKIELADQLYQNKIYNASQFEHAQQYFYNQSLYNSQKEASQFYDNVIGVILQKNHAEKGLQAFIKEYPHSTYFSQANMPLVDYYLAKKDFNHAMATLSKISHHQLSSNESVEYNLKMGYTKYMLGDYNGALSALKQAYKNTNSETQKDIAFMLGHLYYSKEQNKDAFQYFDEIKDKPKFAQLVKPYYLQLYYKEKRYNEAINAGEDLLSNQNSSSDLPEIHKIIGESYFMQNKYEDAYPHLKIFVESKEHPTESDLYEMGFVAAKLQKYTEAVHFYNKLINFQSKLSQNAFYQLGNAYLQTSQKQEALSAFRSAKQMFYDQNVQELAHLQYAKMSYDIGNPFEAASSVIQDFLNNYPLSSATSEMRKLLVKSYLYSGNYKETLSAIDSFSNSTNEIKQIDQEVSFLLGTEEFNKGNFENAKIYFNRSLAYNYNLETNSKALYWLAQTDYQLGDYSSAIQQFTQLENRTNFTEKSQLYYDLAYAYFKSKNFDKAQKYFQKYLLNPDPNFINDAQLRLADTYYAENKLEEAIKIYDKSTDVDDYTLFQKGMALGFQGNSSGKINTLKQLIKNFPNSEYLDDSNYEIGVSSASTGDFSVANDYFSKVIYQSIDKNLIADAKIYKTQILIDQNNDAKALQELENLAVEYKNTTFSDKIVKIARPIFIKNGNVAAYELFASKAGVSLDISEVDTAVLSSAQQFYIQKKYTEAIPLYEKYLVNNSKNNSEFQAKYELGESYFQTKDFTKSLLTFQAISNLASEYQADAQTRLAQIYLMQDNDLEAVKYLLILQNATDVKIANFARIELMKYYAKNNQIKESVKMADLILQNPKNSIAVIEYAKVIKARNIMQNGEDKQAQIAYAALEKSSNSEVAAESMYAKAYYQNKAKAYQSSNETIFKIANNYSSEEFWGAKALILLAKNYMGLKDLYQASYTLDQIIANYQDFPEIVQEAKVLRKSIR